MGREFSGAFDVLFMLAMLAPDFALHYVNCAHFRTDFTAFFHASEPRPARVPPPPAAAPPPARAAAAALPPGSAVI